MVIALTRNDKLWLAKLQDISPHLKQYRLNWPAVFRVATTNRLVCATTVTRSTRLDYIEAYFAVNRPLYYMFIRSWFHFVNNCDNYSNAALNYILPRYSSGYVVEILETLVMKKRITSLLRLAPYLEDMNYTTKHQTVMKTAIRQRCPETFSILLRYYPKFNPAYQSKRFRSSYACMLRRETNTDLFKILLSIRRVRDKLEELRPYDLLPALELCSIEDGLALIDKYCG